MFKIIAGDWKKNSFVVLKKSLTGRPKHLLFPKSAFSQEMILLKEIRTFEYVDEQQGASKGNVIGWGVAGAIVAGPVGAIVGGMAGNAGSDRLAAIELTDGRKVLVKGSASELGILNETMLAKAFEEEPEDPDAPGEATIDLDENDYREVEHFPETRPASLVAPAPSKAVRPGPKTFGRRRNSP